jgi:hypothetical protein
LSAESPRHLACSVDCPGCPDAEPEPYQDPSCLAGWPLVGSAILIFLVPLVFSVVGAIIPRPHPLAQLFGSVAGLIVGMLIVRFLVSVPLGSGGEPG